MWRRDIDCRGDYVQIWFKFGFYEEQVSRFTLIRLDSGSGLAKLRVSMFGSEGRLGQNGSTSGSGFVFGSRVTLVSGLAHGSDSCSVRRYFGFKIVFSFESVTR
ncbi:hypothetical protein HanPI659440_Chr17g0696381 [Helianthus annuus]|nr:hypothetical protein HanPI659440_Chr17g0696381 [Helianthus annuus]